MNTTETNKKFAEFLGVKSDDRGWYEGTDLHNAGLPFSYGAMGNGTRDLKFHNDWNWLMLVVDKIETIEVDGRTFTIDFYKSSVTVFEYGEINDELIFTEGGERLANLYKACSMFIDWYTKARFKMHSLSALHK